MKSNSVLEDSLRLYFQHMFMLFGYNYYEILAYIDVSGDKAVEEEDEYMAVFNVAFTLRLVDQQEVKYNDTANNKNMKDVTTEVEFQEEMGVPSTKACTALRAREEVGRVPRTVRTPDLP